MDPETLEFHHQEPPVPPKISPRTKHRLIFLIPILLMLSSIAILASLMFPSVYAAPIKLTLPGTSDYFSYTRNLLNQCEAAAPGSTGQMRQFIPQEWPLGNTTYYRHYWGYCRKSENTPPACFKSFAESFLENIVYDVPYVVLRNETAKIQQMAADDWKYRTRMAIATAKQTRASVHALQHIYAFDAVSSPILGYLFNIYYLAFSLIVFVFICESPLEDTHDLFFGLFVLVVWWLFLVIEVSVRQNGLVGSVWKEKSLGGYLGLLCVVLTLQTLAVTVRKWQMVNEGVEARIEADLSERV
ncbi:hypothetical protein FT663_04422 [Candidozyma haemuli var. vulneris]|nr:hypothetical protein FT663_04422 [[Candida] haemuloni var. vulneris]KAF3989756.1 hypothetical protein FT662_02631 [[Candida] haemuloni var. vulneris]